MAYKVISTVVTSSKQVGSAAEAAIALATRMDAHLDLHAVGFDRTDPGFYYSGASGIVLESNINEAREALGGAKAVAEKRVAAEGVQWTAKGTILRASAMQRGLARCVRFSDLVVLPRPFSEPSNSSEQAAMAEACLFQAERPVLMMPEDSNAPKDGGRIVVGWNDGAEALSAARAAMPFLQLADQVDICLIAPPRHAHDRSDPGGLLAQYLARHGVKTQVSVLARTEESVGAILIRRALETDAEMLVTGAYGHSRMREAVFGGTSRDLIETCNVPLLMAR